MKSLRRNHMHLAALALTCLLTTAAVAQHEDHKDSKKTYMLHGKIEAVDASEKKLTVNHDKIEGLMEAMTMSYGVDKPEMLKMLKAGDTITATLYEGDMMLHNIRVVNTGK